MTQVFSQFVDFLGAHQSLAILFAFLIAFGEALLILGLFVPSTTVLVGLGALIGLGKMAFVPVYLATVAGAIVGDALSFWAGVHWKERIRTFWPFSRYASLMDKGERFVVRHGGKSIFIARFIPGVKAVVPTIAGMMGMRTTRFTLANVGSAFVWAAVHLLPGVALGRGLQVTGAANPRFALLAAVAAVAAVLAWASMRIARGILIPAVDRARLQLALLLDRQGAHGGALARLLRNHDGALEAASLLGLALGALMGFGLLFAAVVFNPQLSLADAAMGQFVQGLRTDWATSAMVGITMLGDMAVLLPLALMMIVILLAYRQWALASAVAAASLAGTAFVPLFKTVLQRARPIPMYQGADGFSFPSGHSTFATIIFGILALLVAQSVPARFGGWVYAIFAVLIALIALSRVYLLAHWPSDVLAGILFGGALVFFVALVLHARAAAVPGWIFAAVLLVTGLGIMPGHLWTGWTTSYARYDVTAPIGRLAVADWQAGGWQKFPANRILLDGEFGEPMLLQTTRPLAEVVAALETAGWRSSQVSLSGEILSAVLPSRQILADRAPWPLTNLGQPPLATLIADRRVDQRLVLRIWTSDTLVQDASGSAPLLLVSLTAERLDPLAFGFAQLEQAPIVTDQLAAELLALAAALRDDTAQTRGAVGAPVLVVPRPGSP